MLKTYETKPQVLIEVDGLPAVCTGSNCDYQFVEPVGEITSFTFSEATNRLVITGTNLPSVATDIQSIEFAKSSCTVDTTTLSATNIECDLDYEPTCGTETPKLISIHGEIPHAIGLASQTVDCTVTSATPTTELNMIGADNITITGTHFPRELAKSTVQITFDDAAATTCTAVSSTTTTLVCLTNSFDTAVSSG
jgi:hypothetical protein